MIERIITLASLTVIMLNASAQHPRGNVKSYETAYNLIVVSGDKQGIRKLNGDTLVCECASSLTAILLDPNGNPLKRETYMGVETHNSTASFYPVSKVTPEKTMENFSRGINWDSPAEWTEYSYKDGKLINQSTNGNNKLSQISNISYEYNSDGTIRKRISKGESGLAGITEIVEYYVHNGKTDSLEVSHFNSMGTEVMGKYSHSAHASRNSIDISWEAVTPYFKREKCYYSYSPDGSYRIRYVNDGTGKTEYYDCNDKLVRTIMPDGKEYKNEYNSQGDPLLLHTVRRTYVESVKFDLYLYDNNGNWTSRRVFEQDNDGLMIPHHLENRRYCYEGGEIYESSAFNSRPQPEPWYIYDMRGEALLIQRTRLFPGEELQEIDDSTLKRLMSLPDFKHDDKGNMTIQNHPAIILRLTSNQ